MAVHLQGRQENVQHPQNDQENARKVLSASGSAQFRFSEKSGISSDHQKGDGHGRANGVQGYAEAQCAGRNVECGFLKCARKEKLGFDDGK